jgi:hypothetical protein
MTENDKWLADQCLEILGDKDRGTVEYIKTIAKKSTTLHQLEQGLNDFEIPMQENPRNKYFALELYEKFGSRTINEKKKTAEVKRKPEY